MSGTGDGPPAGGASPLSEGQLSHREASEYIVSILEGLTQVANRAHMPFLAYLINMALEEAKLERRVGTGDEPGS
jgi:hypothetical protein